MAAGHLPELREMGKKSKSYLYEVNPVQSDSQLSIQASEEADQAGG